MNPTIPWSAIYWSFSSIFSPLCPRSPGQFCAMTASSWQRFSNQLSQFCEILVLRCERFRPGAPLALGHAASPSEYGRRIGLDLFTVKRRVDNVHSTEVIFSEDSSSRWTIVRKGTWSAIDQYRPPEFSSVWRQFCVPSCLHSNAR